MNAPIWTGDNRAAVVRYLASVTQERFCDDWIEELPDGSLMLFGDPVVYVEVGETIPYPWTRS